MFTNDYPMKLDDIGVRKLPNDGCLLEELYSIFFSCPVLECLHSYVHLPASFFGSGGHGPFPLKDYTELTTTQDICRAVVYVHTRAYID